MKGKSLLIILIVAIIAISITGCVGMLDARAWRPIPPFKFKRDAVPDSLNQSTDSLDLGTGNEIID